MKDDSDKQESEEWIVVRSKKTKRIQKQIHPGKIHTKGNSIPLLTGQSDILREQLLSSPSFAHNSPILNYFIKDKKAVSIVCLGLGHFQQSVKPHLQWIFFKEAVVKQVLCNNSSIKVNVFDPVFSEQQLQEVRVEGWSCKPLEDIFVEGLHVFYMPHCQRFLYQKVCDSWAKTNRGSCLIIGNSIKQYKQRCTLLGQNIPDTFKEINPQETRLKDFKEAFNDTYVYLL